MKQKLLLKSLVLLFALIAGSSSVWAQSPITIWSENFNGLEENATPTAPTNASYTGVTYTCTDGAGSSPGSTKIMNGNVAKGASAPEMMVGKKGSGTGAAGGKFTAVIPLDNFAGTLTLTYYQNKYKLKVSSTTTGVSGGKELKPDAEGQQTTTFTGITTEMTSITIVFEATTTNNVRLDDIVLTGYHPSSISAPTFSPAGGIFTSAQNVTLACATDGTTIYYTTDGTDPTSSSAQYTGSAISVSSTTTIKAIAKKGDDYSSVSTATYAILAHAGTEADPFTVTDARDALDASEIDSETDYYVKGYIAKIGTFNEGQLTYWISDDGSMTNNVQCYKGKNVGGAAFAAATDLEVGDIATVKGKLKIFSGTTYELDENNEVVSITTRTKVNIATFTATTTTLVLGGTNTTTTSVTNDQVGWTPVSYSYESDAEAVATVDASGVITAVAKGTANITVTPVVSATDPTYKVGDSKSIEITVSDPSHTASFSVNGVIDPANNVVVEEGEAITFPANPASVGGKAFAGWVATPIVGTTDDAPSFVSSPTMSTSDVTYYAVFGNSSETLGWRKLAASEVTEAGTYALLTTDGHAFNGTISDGHGQVTTNAFSFVNNVATSSPEGTCEITLTVSSTGFTMYNETNKYLYATKAATKGLAWHESEDNIWKYANENWEYQKDYSGSKARLRSYNNSSFRTYSANNGDVLVFAKKTNVTTYSAYCTSVTVSLTPAYTRTTYVTTRALDFSNVDGLKAYAATAATGGVVTFAEVGAVPASTPLMLIGTVGKTYNVPVVASASAPAVNMLKSGDGTTVFGGTTYDYILYSDGLFYKITSGTVATTKAYLHCTSDPTAGGGARGLDVVFGDETVINALENTTKMNDGAIYDLSGRRVENPTKGIYIINGKKVIFK